MKAYKLFEDENPEPPELRNRENIPDDIRKAMMDAFALLRALLFPVKATIDEFYKTLSDRVIEYLMMGKTRPLPEGWFGKVYTTMIMGNKTVIAMIGQLGEPKDLSSQFRSEYTKSFGTDRPKFTEDTIETARCLTLKLNGMKIKDIVDIYAERHPEEFPADIMSNGYRFEKRKKEESMKKRLQRLQIDINSITRDK